MSDYAGRDRLRELLDAVLDDEHRTLGDMAGGAFSSPYHFARGGSPRDAGEPPVAMKRRVMLERAAWQLRQGTSVTGAAFDAGYESVEGFSRAFARAYGHLPSEDAGDPSSWLPAPNGIHFHPPTSLWVHSGERTMSQPIDHLIHHDLDDTRALLDRAKELPDETYRRQVRPGQQVISWDGPDDSVASVLTHQVFTKEVWVAAIEGEDFPEHGADDVAGLLARHDAVAGRWLSMVRDVERRGAWDDRIVDALCDPPESFVLGSILAHVLSFGAARRQLARIMLRDHGLEIDDGDPIAWLSSRNGLEGAGVTSTVYYTATTLDGYLADEEDSLHWLFKQEQDEDGAFSYQDFIAGTGALCMGATTYEWILPHLTDGWAYEQPTWVFTHRDLPKVEGDVRFVRGDVGPVHEEMVAAAGGKDVWVVGGGDLAAQFAEAGLLDRMLLSIAPVTLGAGRPLFPRPFDLRLVDLARNGAFACATYDVVGPLQRGPEDPGNL